MDMAAYIPLIQTAMWVGLALISFWVVRNPVIDRIKAGGGIKVGPVELQEVKGKSRKRSASDK